MILTKSKIYELNLFLPEIYDKEFREDYMDNYMDWNLGMASAIVKGHKKLVCFFISEGADDWNSGMSLSTKENNENLIDFFISRGADKWTWGLVSAHEKGSEKLLHFFISKGEINRNNVISFCTDQDWIDF